MQNGADEFGELYKLLAALNEQSLHEGDIVQHVRGNSRIKYEIRMIIEDRAVLRPLDSWLPWTVYRLDQIERVKH